MGWRTSGQRLFNLLPEIRNPDVRRAMQVVPRHFFVPSVYRDVAYEDHPLPIGYGQTISQPHLVAVMIELLNLKPAEKVLEIGTGSGYQTALLAELGYVEVYSVEIVPELAEQAEARLKTLGYNSVHLKHGDGYYGWEEHAPFDAIVVTAASEFVPPQLLNQLADGGRMVIPVGSPDYPQTLWKLVKEGTDLKAYEIGGVAFVPFTRRESPDASRKANDRSLAAQRADD